MLNARMTPATLLKGVVLGFSIAAPVGPIGVLCIRRSLADGLNALLAEMGAASDSPAPLFFDDGRN